MFLSRSELLAFDFMSCGRDVLISEHAVLYGTERISIGDHVRIDPMSLLFAEAICGIGSYVHIGSYSFFGGRHGIVMEDFSGLSVRVSLFTGNDDWSGEWLSNPTVPPELAGGTTGPVHLGRHAMVGAGTVVLPGVTFGEGAVVGAQSLVPDDLEAWTIHGGVPARPLKARSRRVLELEARVSELDGPDTDG